MPLATLRQNVANAEFRLKSEAATVIARWWRGIRTRKETCRDESLVRTKLFASLSWTPANGPPADGILAINLLCEQDPTAAKSGINEAAQFQSTLDVLAKKLKIDVHCQTFKRGPTLVTSKALKTFIASHPRLHVVISGHGGVTWGHYLGKYLVPHVSFLAPVTKGIHESAIWSWSRPQILEWMIKYLEIHRYVWPAVQSVSFDVCQICADLHEDTDNGYASGTFTCREKTVCFRGPIHAAFVEESRRVVPAHMLEVGPFRTLVDMCTRIDELEAEIKALREEMSRREDNDLLDLSVDGIISMLNDSAL